MAKLSRKSRGGKYSAGKRRSTAPSQRPASYPEIIKSNELYEKYYNSLTGYTDGSENSRQFWQYLRQELPNSFRFTGSRSHALTVQKRLIDYYIPLIKELQKTDPCIQPPQQIQWYPNRLAWCMTTPRKIIRKFEPLAEFQKFLVSETTVGNISRQEVVSMIPPLLLELDPTMIALDLCAAPGSKSAQLLEMLHAQEEMLVENMAPKFSTSQKGSVPDGANTSDQGRATGILIANDVDYRRSQTLIHQAKRLKSANLIVTNHDASIYPSIQLPSSSPDVPRKYLKFDRILADVPCSGDGTVRKNPNIWRDWTPGNALGLHALQVRILCRALQMLKVGGCVAYSTCSMNPVENEAVVQHAIISSGGPAKIRIVDCLKKLPELKREPGLTKWSVMDRSGNLYQSWSDYQHHIDTAGETVGQHINEFMFPMQVANSCLPSDTDHGEDNEDNKIPLERCLRIYPHLQDTGGFFIAILEKLAEITQVDNVSRESNIKTTVTMTTTNETVQSPIDNENPSEDARANSSLKRAISPTTQPPAKKLQTATAIPTLQEHFNYLPIDHSVINEILTFYGVEKSFPRDRFLVKNPTAAPVKAIYYTCALIRDILLNNIPRGMRFLHAGVKMFLRQDVQRNIPQDDQQDNESNVPKICPWRIQNEGLSILYPWISDNRTVRLTSWSTLHVLLRNLFPKLNGEEWCQLGEIGTIVQKFSVGFCTLVLEPGKLPADPMGVTDTESSNSSDSSSDTFDERLVWPLWRSMYSVNLMLPKEDRAAILLRLFRDTKPPVDCSLRRD